MIWALVAGLLLALGASYFVQGHTKHLVANLVIAALGAVFLGYYLLGGWLLGYGGYWWQLMLLGALGALVFLAVGHLVWRWVSSNQTPATGRR